jgi:hypothetical protein
MATFSFQKGLYGGKSFQIFKRYFYAQKTMLVFLFVAYAFDK